MQFLRSGSLRLRIVALSAGGAILILVVTALIVLSFGWSYLRVPLERRLTASMGRPVTIGAVRRIDHGFLVATLAIDDVRVPQPGWVGGGDFIRVRRATVMLPILPLLHGAVRPRSIALDGLFVALVRRQGEHANWTGLPAGGRRGGGLPHLSIRDGHLSLDDFKRDHFLRGTIAASDDAFLVAGSGSLIGRPATVRLAGTGPVGKDRWPFRLDYRSAVANLTLAGIADEPLDIGHYNATVHAWGDDLKHIDLLVGAGLPGTAPVELVAQVRHDRPDWLMRSALVTIGRSHFTGAIDIRERGDRTILDGHVVSTGLDFADLASADGRAPTAPGRRLPDTRIDLSRLGKTDGRVDLDIRRLLFSTPSAFTSLKGTLVLDHGLLTAAPFVVGLARGALGGKVTVRQSGSATRLALDLRLTGGRIEAMASDATAFTGALDGRFVLAGPGRTIRAALGASSGRFALVGRHGTLGRQVALLLGEDGRGVFAKKSEVARLWCGIGSFVVRDGRGTPAPLVIDTNVARAEASGLIDLRDERIDLSLTGAPKQASVLRLSGPIRVTGKLFAPSFAAPQATSREGILKSIGRAIGGRSQPLASDADCTGLAARALR